MRDQKVKVLMFTEKLRLVRADLIDHCDDLGVTLSRVQQVVQILSERMQTQRLKPLVKSGCYEAFLITGEYNSRMLVNQTGECVRVGICQGKTRRLSLTP